MRLQELKEHIASTEIPVGELVEVLEISIDDLLDRFPDHVLDFAYKFNISLDNEIQS